MELGRGVKGALGNPFMPECSLNLRFIEAANLACSFSESRKTYLKGRLINQPLFESMIVDTLRRDLKGIRWSRAMMSAINLP